MLHIQIGPSPLALGLIVPSTLAAGFDVCVVGRPGDKSLREYGHAGSGPRGRLRFPRVDWFVGPEKFEDLPFGLLSRIQSDEPLLLTCTLRGRIAERRPLVEALLRARPEGSETIMLACENAPDPIYEQIAAGCGQHGVQVLRTVVNRMCIGLPRDSEGHRMVSAHPLGEWLIDQPAQPSALLDALSAVDEVDVVEDIEARHSRKLWMVNGAHQALALIAWAGLSRELRLPPAESAAGGEPHHDLQDAAQDLSVSARLSHLHAAMDAALRKEHPELEDNLAYGVEHVVAYSEHPDSITRVLGAFLRHNLAPFVETLDVRLAQPARICFELQWPTTSFEFVFDHFEMLAGNLDVFLDARQIRAGSVVVDPAADGVAIELYARLVRGWMSREQAEERVARFAKALAACRP